MVTDGDERILQWQREREKREKGWQQTSEND